jgi:hypothetical protein
MFDEYIDTFIHIGRLTWDFGCFIFDRDHVYDIKGRSQARGVDFHLQGIGLHLYMVHMFDNLMMV